MRNSNKLAKVELYLLEDFGEIEKAKREMGEEMPKSELTRVLTTKDRKEVRNEE